MLSINSEKRTLIDIGRQHRACTRRRRDDTKRNRIDVRLSAVARLKVSFTRGAVAIKTREYTYISVFSPRFPVYVFFFFFFFLFFSFYNLGKYSRRKSLGTRARSLLVPIVPDRRATGPAKPRPVSLLSGNEVDIVLSLQNYFIVPK